MRSSRLRANGTAGLEDATVSPDAAEAPADAFLDFWERRGISDEEKDLILNTMAFLCYQQVQNRHGPFCEAIKPLIARPV